MRTAIKACAVAAVFVVLLEPFGALANYYERGNWICDDFADMEQTYRSEPENIYFQRGYAGCLITRGQGNDDAQGMNILHNIVEHSTHPGRVGAAWKIANYVGTGGTFENRVDEDTINEAIEAFGKVLFFIRLDPNYPDGNYIYEEEAQIELKSHYWLPLLYFAKFKYGGSSTHHMHLLRSPSYEGDRDLKTYPDYAPYTIDSLERAIEFADQCLALPMKWYFKPEQYVKITAGCRVLKEAAAEILPLERQRLVLLDTESCGDDLAKCSEYDDLLVGKLSPTILRANAEMREIFLGK